MNTFLHGVARAVAETFELPEPILEIGSLQVQGSTPESNLRPLWAGKRYVGLDRRPGPGVDVVGDVEALPLASGSVGTVIAMSTFEHVRHFWRGFEEIHRVLRPDGAVLVSCPFYFYIHAYPSDYWRFTPDALELLLEDYPQRILGRQGPPRRPTNVWALAFAAGRPTITEGEWQRYRRLLGCYAHQPLRWSKRLRYGMGRFLCGARPFAPYVEQGRWDTHLRRE